MWYQRVRSEKSAYRHVGFTRFPIIDPANNQGLVASDDSGRVNVLSRATIEGAPAKHQMAITGSQIAHSGGRVLLVSWGREAGGNDFSYQKYFLPMLSSFKLLK
jgi:hypothetical protein